MRRSRDQPNGTDSSSLDSARADHPAAPPTKRRRTALACNICRARKTRCNGRRPKCQLCESAGTDCLYDEPDTATGQISISIDYLESLESRILCLEQNMKKHAEVLNITNQSVLTSNERLHQNPDDLLIDATRLDEAAVEQPPTDGMAISFLNESNLGFFGPSSNIALIRSILRAISATSTGIEPPASDELSSFYAGKLLSVPQPAHQLQLSDSHDSISEDEDMYRLPAESETRQLLKEFFSNTGLLFPYIHEPTFWDEFNKMCTEKFVKVRRSWLGLLNMILAMATDAAPLNDIEIRAQKSKIFFQRAFSLCRIQMLRGASLETTQFLLLMSQYLQGTHSSLQTWATHGLAVRAAFCLGLYLDKPPAQFSPVEVEMRRRTWHGCIMLDRNLSMAFGRPPTIPQAYIGRIVPQVCQGEASTEEGVQSYREIGVEFYKASVTLYKVTCEVLSALYKLNLEPSLNISIADLVYKIFKLEQDAADWEREIPSVLKLHGISIPEHTDYRLERLNVVLTLRYYNLQVLMYRPMLEWLLDLRTKPLSQAAAAKRQSTYGIAITLCRSCTQAAERTIRLSEFVSKSRRNCFGARWSTIYSVFNAGLIIFGGLFAFPPEEMPEFIQQALSLLTIAVETLKNFDGNNQIAVRCADYLDLFRRHAETWNSESGQQFSINPVGHHVSQASSFVRDGVSQAEQQAASDPTPFASYPGGLDDMLGAVELELGQFFQMESLERDSQMHPP